MRQLTNNTFIYQLTASGSHTYDLTNTLQSNLTRPLAGSSSASKDSSSNIHYKADHAFHEPSTASQSKTAWGFNDKFIWNHFLLQPAFRDRMNAGRDATGWVLPIIYGYVDQASKYRLSSYAWCMLKLPCRGQYIWTNYLCYFDRAEIPLLRRRKVLEERSER